MHNKNKVTAPSMVPLVASALAGAIAMYFFDPRLGKRRRAVARDQAEHFGRTSLKYLGGAAVDVQQRTRGLVLECVSAFRNEPVDDDVLVARVRSALGHALPHLGQIEVSALRGEITLEGTVAPDEGMTAVRAAYAVPGVNSVSNELTDADERSQVFLN